ncbi:MAG: inorganic phosphate transporter [Candidatus Goldbacteria bacterium]|nr:inorganic phosphate transporter [Candidatus Goldiibacteriota bacterium]
MDNSLLWVLSLTLLALIFDFYNGANDAANSISTIVATKVLKPWQAVLWAAFFNFIALILVGTAVAKTIGKGIIDINIVDNYVIFGTLIGAAGWTAFATYNGLPISASHSLIGGLIGSAIAKAGNDAVVYSGLYKVLIFIILSPLIGMILGIGMLILIYNIFKNYHPNKIEHLFRKGQLLSSALYSIGHGGNDAQKTAGIITMLLYSNGYLKYDGGEFIIPFWVIFISHLTIALGTLAGGWKVVNTLGHKLTKLKPVDGFAAETAAAITLHTVTHFGIPVSTTHTITGAIMGAGSAKRIYSVKWSISKNIIQAWIFTIPISAIISATSYILIKKVF